MDALASTPLLLCFGPFELDPIEATLRENGVLRRLPAQPFRVLVLLLEHAGEVVSRTEIRQCLWGARKYVEVDRGINFCLNQIRGVLRDPAEASRYIKTVTRQGYVFNELVVRIARDSAPAAPHAPAERPLDDCVAPAPTVLVRPRRPRSLSAVGVLLLLAVALLPIADAPSLHRQLPPAPIDSIIVTDFANRTGDAVFDDTLREALVTELKQSPSLSVVSDENERRALALMRLSADARITRAIGMDLCHRTGSKVVIAAEISRMGSQYLLNLKEIACATGDILHSERREVARKEDVLSALHQASSGIRAALGASLPSLQKFDIPEADTTVSLEALQSYTRAIKVLKAQGDIPSIPLFKRAIELDPMFAMAYAALAGRYNNLSQPGQALEYAAQAYELRGRVSERERLIITSRYHRLRGEIEQLTQVLQFWISEYPRDANPHGSLGVNLIMQGHYPQALAELRTALLMQQDDASMYDNLGTLYLVLNRLSDAREVLNIAATHHVDSAGLRIVAYDLAFLEGSAGAMQEQMDWSLGRPGVEDILLSAQSDTEAFSGHLKSAYKYSERAAASATRAGFNEAAALWTVNAALRNAEYGAGDEAKRGVAVALKLARGRNVLVLAALCLARVGDTNAAQKLVDQLAHDYSTDTMLTVYRLPVIKAAIALSDGDAQRALEILEDVKPYDLARPSPSGMANMYPAFLRGGAYALLGDGVSAEKEYLQVIDHPGLTLNSPLAVLAPLQLARLYSSSGQKNQARALYGRFLLRWNDADTDASPLPDVRVEFARLH